MGRTILFVCPHGAGKSRMAAAIFNRLAPAGWQATSAVSRSLAIETRGLFAARMGLGLTRFATT